MAVITGLDIPSGLEALFAAALQNKSNSLTDALGLTLPKPNYAKKKRISKNSPIVRLLPYWNGLTSLQKNDWTLYWEILEFSDHRGSGGWPGSGYAAFVYTNAPRLKAHLSIILNAPLSGTYDIIFGFGAQSQEITGSVTGWQHNSFLFTADATDASIGSIGFESLGDAFLLDNVSVTEAFPSVGANLVTNGDFSLGSTDWTRISGHPRYNSNFAFIPNGAGILQNILIVDTYSYLFEFDYLAVAS